MFLRSWIWAKLHSGRALFSYTVPSTNTSLTRVAQSGDGSPSAGLSAGPAPGSGERRSVAPAVWPLLPRSAADARHGRVREPTTIVPLRCRGGIGRQQRRRRCPMCRPERRTPARLGRQRDRCAIAPRTSRCRDCARGPARRAGSIARPGRSANGSAWPTLRALGRGDRLLPGPDRRADAAGAAGFLSVCIRTPPNPWPKRVSIDVLAPGSSERPAERRTS
jgi:hypothetical protein